MKSVSHGKPCAGNPHARFEEGASASKTPRRNALLHPIANTNTQLETGNIGTGNIPTMATLKPLPLCAFASLR